MPVADAFATVVESGGGAAVVVAPADTTQNKASGEALTAKTFGAFTDDDSRIDNYLAETVTVSGSCSWSGSGLGPYTPTSADGDAGTLLLHARDSDNNILATAVHSYSRAAASVDNPEWELVWSTATLDDYDALTTGGDGGSGGEGAHDLGLGSNSELDYEGETPNWTVLGISGDAIVHNNERAVSGANPIWRIPLDTDADDTICIVGTFLHETDNYGANLFYIGDSLVTTLRTGNLHMMTNTPPNTTGNWRFRNGSSFTSFGTQGGMGYADGDIIAYRITWMAGRTVTCEMWPALTTALPTPWETPPTTRHMHTRSTSGDTVTHWAPQLSTPGEYRVAIYKQHQSAP